MMKELPLPFTINLPGLGRSIEGVSTFSILLVLAFLAATILVPKELRRRGLDPQVTDWAILLAVVGTIVGAKIGFVFEVWGSIWVVDSDWQDTLYQVLFTFQGMGNKLPGEAIGLWEALFSSGGLVFYGGFLFSFFLLWLFMKFKDYHPWRYGDAFIPALALGYGIGRLGCLVSGDGCFGYQASVDIPLFTMIYGANSLVPTGGVAVWNTPLMEAIASFALFGFYMKWARFQNFRPGMLIAIFLVFNGVVRFLVEFLRLNDAVIAVRKGPVIELIHGLEVPLDFRTAIDGGYGTAYYFENWFWYGFTQSQIVAVVMVGAGLAWIFARRLYEREQRPATGA